MRGARPRVATVTVVDRVVDAASGSFGVDTEILDFTCWGVNPHGTRKTQAETVGKWTGACNAALTAGAYTRNVNTTGTTAADYDTTSAPTPSDCTP